MTLPILSATASSAQTTNAAPTYSITTTTTNVFKNNTVVFTVNTTGVTDGTTLYWTNAGTSVNSDFTDNLGSGSFTITNNTGSISRTLINNVVVEGKTIILDLRTGSVSGSIVASSPTVNIISTSVSPTYSITADKYSTQAGTVVNFTITTTNVPNNTTLYLTYGGTAYPAGVVIQTNEFTIFNNVSNSPAYVQFSPTVTAGQTLTASVRTGSLGGPIVASLTQNIVIAPSGTTGDNVVGALFSGGVEGCWYDPSDRTTMFSDFKGTQTAIEGQVVLLLDKSKGLGLGPERITNGNFTNGSANWSKGAPNQSLGPVPVANNKMQVNETNLANTYYAFQSLSATSNGLQPLKLYKITFTISNYVQGDLYFLLLANWGDQGYASPGYSQPWVNGNGNYTCYIPVRATNENYNLKRADQPTLNYFCIIVKGPATFEISNISVKELYGSHACASPIKSRLDYTHFVPKLSARVNLLTGTSSWTAGTSQTVYIGALNSVPRKSVKLSWNNSGSVKYTLNTTTGSSDYTVAGDPSNRMFVQIPLSPTTYSITIAHVSGTVSDIDLRWFFYGSTMPNYQRVTTATDYESNGFPLYLQFNTDYVDPSNSYESQWLLSNWDVFAPNTNQVTAWCGAILTSTTGLTGYIYNYFPASGITNQDFPFYNYPLGGYFGAYLIDYQTFYQFPIRGYNGSSYFLTTGTTSGISYDSPQNHIQALKIDWTVNSINCAQIYLNGVLSSKQPGSINNGPFTGPVDREVAIHLGCYVWSGNYGPANPLRGKIYSLIFRGAASSDTELNTIGTYIANKMGGNFWNNI